MKVRELIASLRRVARRNSPPETDGGGEQNTDNEAEIVWLTVAPLRTQFFGRSGSSISEASPLRELDYV
jgi:hypothetical protein